MCSAPTAGLEPCLLFNNGEIYGASAMATWPDLHLQRQIDKKKRNTLTDSVMLIEKINHFKNVIIISLFLMILFIKSQFT